LAEIGFERAVTDFVVVVVVFMGQLDERAKDGAALALAEFGQVIAIDNGGRWHLNDFVIEFPALLVVGLLLIELEFGIGKGIGEFLKGAVRGVGVARGVVGFGEYGILRGWVVAKGEADQ